MKKFPKESYGSVEFEILHDDETGELYLISTAHRCRMTFKPEELYEVITELGRTYKKALNLDVAIKF